MTTEPATPAPASTETPAPAAAKVHQRAAQSRVISDEITASAQSLGIVIANPEIGAALAPAGYSQEELDAGLKLQRSAQAAFDSRQTAVGRASQAKTACAKAEADARQTFGDYRKIAQAEYPEAPDRQALGASGRSPKDPHVFVTTARAAFNAARQSPYASVLAKRGYDKAGLDKAVAVFDALDAAQSAYLTATGAAADSLRVRDQAARELIVWMSKFRRIASVVLRDKPEMRQKLGL